MMIVYLNYVIFLKYIIHFLYCLIYFMQILDMPYLPQLNFIQINVNNPASD